MAESMRRSIYKNRRAVNLVLDNDLADLLTLEAQRRRTSMSALVREAVAEKYAAELEAAKQQVSK